MDFIKLLASGTQPEFSLQSPSGVDNKGLFYWIGTNGGSASVWQNPLRYNLVNLLTSEGSSRRLAYGSGEDILSRDINPCNTHLHDKPNGWISIDLGLWVIPTAYTLRHAKGYPNSALRNWDFEVSKDNITWVVLMYHVEDTALTEPGSVASWPLCPPPAHATDAWRYLRLRMTGVNSGNSHIFSISGLEVYGTIVRADVLPVVVRPVHLTTGECRPGVRVVRGQDWKWMGQDSGGVGSVVSEIRNGWVDVVWKKSKNRNSYRMGHDGKYDLRVLSSSEEVGSLPTRVLSSSEEAGSLPTRVLSSSEEVGSLPTRVLSSSEEVGSLPSPPTLDSAFPPYSGILSGVESAVGAVGAVGAGDVLTALLEKAKKLKSEGGGIESIVTDLAKLDATDVSTELSTAIAAVLQKYEEEDEVLQKYEEEDEDDGQEQDDGQDDDRGGVSNFFVLNVLIIC